LWSLVEVEEDQKEEAAVVQVDLEPELEYQFLEVFQSLLVLVVMGQLDKRMMLQVVQILYLEILLEL